METANLKWWHWKRILRILGLGVFVLLVCFLFILLLIAFDRAYGGRPPVAVTSLDPKDLGEVCPGDLIPFHNQVYIEEVTIALYDLSTMDTTRTYNILGTQRRYQGLPHPVEDITFTQTVPWHVPFIDPGRYARIFAARGHQTDEKPGYVWSYFTIKPRGLCP